MCAVSNTSLISISFHGKDSIASIQIPAIILTIFYCVRYITLNYYHFDRIFRSIILDFYKLYRKHR